MVYEASGEVHVQERQTEVAARELRLDQSYLTDLIEVLASNPKGLRRWSVMRALRKARESAGRDVPQKFEDDVERVFRRFCSTTDVANDTDRLSGSALFYRPQERAGEVWAVFPVRAELWLKSDHIERDR
jgi:hypothetical protein